jgi:ATP-dependent Clp protease adapter protein ClpS
MKKALFILQQNTEVEQQELPGPDVITEVEDDEKTPWRVMLFDDDIHTFEEVINQLMKALHCDTPYAEELTLQVHNEGKAKVFEGSFEACLDVNGVLEEIQLITEIKG